MMKKLVAALVVPAALALDAETYTWTGSVSLETGTAGNWTVNGETATAAPGLGDTVVFTNAAAMTLVKSAELRYLKYDFRGAGVTLPDTNSRRQYGYGGGGIVASGAGTYSFAYPLELNSSQFTDADKTFVVDVAAGAAVKVTGGSGTTKIYSPAEFVKRGAGAYHCEPDFCRPPLRTADA